MPRRLSEATVEWKLHIPIRLAAKVADLLLDPKTQRPLYGGRSELVTTLLQRHLDQLSIQQLQYSTPSPHDRKQD